MSLVCWINGEQRQFDLNDGASVRTVLEAEGYLQAGVTPRARIIVARNEQLVPQALWANEAVSSNDRIDVVGAVTGG